MSNIFHSLRTLLCSRSLGIALFCVLLLLLGTPDLALAAEGPVSKITAPLTNLLGAGFASIIVYVIIGLVFVTTYFAIMLGNLMDSTYILESGMGETLYQVWTVLRNFVNIGFILLLLLLAIMTVLGVGGGEQGTGLLKKVLPKFILALFFVNLTFFGCRVILTTSDVLSTAIFSLPSSIKLLDNKSSTMLFCERKEGVTVKNGQVDIDACSKQVLTNIESAISPDPNDDLGSTDKVFNIVKKWNNNRNNFSANHVNETFDKHNGPFILMTHMLTMNNILDATKWSGGGSASINALFSLVSAIMISVIIFALFLAMIVRMAVLWIGIALSPIIALGIVLQEMFQFDMSSGGLDIKKQFINHAFLPVFTAIPLSIGFIMILAGNTMGYDITKAELVLTSSTPEGSTAINNIIWWIASVIVLWFGSFKALEAADWANMAATAVKTKAESFAQGVGGTLKYMPIAPIGGHSIHEITSMPGIISDKFRTTSGARAEDNAVGLLKASGVDRSWWNRAMTGTQLHSEARSTSAEMAKDPSKASEKIKSFATSIANNNGWSTAEKTTVDKDFILNINNSNILKPSDYLTAGMTYAAALERIAGKATDEDIQRFVSTQINRAKSAETGEKSEATGVLTLSAGNSVDASKAKNVSTKKYESADGKSIVEITVGEGDNAKTYKAHEDGSGKYIIVGAHDDMNGKADGKLAEDAKPELAKMVGGLSLESDPRAATDKIYAKIKKLEKIMSKLELKEYLKEIIGGADPADQKLIKDNWKNQGLSVLAEDVGLSVSTD